MHPLMRFFQKRADTTDVFCLQEVLSTSQTAVDEKHANEYLYGDLFNAIAKVLPKFTGHYARFSDDPDRQSLALFVKNTLTVSEVGDMIVYEPKEPILQGSHIISSRKLQHVTITTPKGPLTLLNYHGLWTGGSKKDTPERLEQSRRIQEHLTSIAGDIVLVGDFNLLPDTESMKILRHGLRDLIAEFKITSTRNRLYRNYYDTTEPNFADYILVSPNVAVENFSVLDDLVSDHAPLLLKTAA